MTAELVSELRHPLGVRAYAKGGVQVLPGGGTRVSWGTVPAITEFLADGSVCLDVQVGQWSASVSGANGLSRAYKFDYKGTPYWDPVIAVVDCKVYFSWNGRPRCAFGLW
ncbi:hypothetical protein MN608_09399 [Microdochium nivale]|nr:hypothetical protein MN608_09399 [Microdochium nivale]